MRAKMNQKLMKAITFKAAPEGGWRAIFDGQTIGTVKPCRPGTLPHPFCGDCGGWHAYVGRTVDGQYRDVNLSAFSTRRDAAVGCLAALAAWGVPTRTTRPATR